MFAMTLGFDSTYYLMTFYVQSKQTFSSPVIKFDDDPKNGKQKVSVSFQISKMTWWSCYIDAMTPININCAVIYFKMFNVTFYGMQ